MRADSKQIDTIKAKYDRLQWVLNERGLRIWCATEAHAIGYGGVTAVHQATKVSRITITNGLKELNLDTPLDASRIRKPGGGRKKLTDTKEGLLESLDKLIEPATRGDPENPLRWSSKSTTKLAEELTKEGYNISQKSVYNLLRDQNYSLKANKKTKEGKEDHPDRDAQFQHINEKVKEFQKNKNPVLSVDTKKKENIGNFKNNGREWMPKGEWEEVNTHDFPDKALGKAAPYGIYDMTRNEGWVNVGISHDTAEFAVHSIRTWWNNMGKELYENCTEIMVTADCGGSNSYRTRLWKFELQKFADEIGKSIKVCHFPPGTSKWNKIEHRMFSCISQNWRGKPLVSLQTIVELIGNTKTKTGLKIKTSIDNNHYETGRKISDEEFESINLERSEFHGNWNYTILPRSTPNL
jgi:transposase